MCAHGLHHTVASQGTARGTPLPIVARMFGYAQPTIAICYAHVWSCEVGDAADHVGTIIAAAIARGLMNNPNSWGLYG